MFICLIYSVWDKKRVLLTVFFEEDSDVICPEREGLWRNIWWELIWRSLNYLGAEPARYQLRIHNFLSIIEFNLECPPLKGAMGDDQLCFRTKFGEHRNLESHPPAHSVRFPLQRGTFIRSDPKPRGFNPLRIDFSLILSWRHEWFHSSVNYVIFPWPDVRVYFSVMVIFNCDNNITTIPQFAGNKGHYYESI